MDNHRELAIDPERLRNDNEYRREVFETIGSNYRLIVLRHCVRILGETEGEEIVQDVDSVLPLLR